MDFNETFRKSSWPLQLINISKHGAKNGCSSVSFANIELNHGVIVADDVIFFLGLEPPLHIMGLIEDLKHCCRMNSVLFLNLQDVVTIQTLP